MDKHCPLEPTRCDAWFNPLAGSLAIRWSVRGQQDVLEVVQRRLTCADGWRTVVLPVKIESTEAETTLRVVIEDMTAGRGLVDLIVAPEQLVASDAPGWSPLMSQSSQLLEKR